MNNPTAIYNLPYPPTVNTYWRSIGRGRVIISAAGREYRKDVCNLLRGARKAEGRLCVTVAVTMPDRRIRDLDNLPKAIFDALKHAGAYEDDSQIKDFRFHEVGIEKPGGVVVTVSALEAAPPRFAADNCS